MAQNCNKKFPYGRKGQAIRERRGALVGSALCFYSPLPFCLRLIDNLWSYISKSNTGPQSDRNPQGPGARITPTSTCSIIMGAGILKMAYGPSLRTSSSSALSIVSLLRSLLERKDKGKVAHTSKEATIYCAIQSTYFQ